MCLNDHRHENVRLWLRFCELNDDVSCRISKSQVTVVESCSVIVSF